MEPSPRLASARPASRPGQDALLYIEPRTAENASPGPTRRRSATRGVGSDFLSILAISASNALAELPPSWKAQLVRREQRARNRPRAASKAFAWPVRSWTSERLGSIAPSRTIARMRSG